MFVLIQFCRNLLSTIPATPHVMIHQTVNMEHLPPATKLGQGNVFTRVCDSVNKEMSASVYAGIPPRRQTPQEEEPPDPPAQSMLGDTVNVRAVRFLLERNLV